MGENYQKVTNMLERRDAGKALPGDDQIADDIEDEDVVDLEKIDTDPSVWHDQWCELRLKFRACQIVPGYVALEDEFGWERMFDDTHDDGIYDPC